MIFEDYLKENNFVEKAVDCVCPHCVTVSQFISSHGTGKYILVCQEKNVAVVDGVYFQTEDIGDEIVLYYYEGGK